MSEQHVGFVNYANKRARKEFVDFMKTKDYFDPEVFNEDVSLDKMYALHKAYEKGDLFYIGMINECEDDPIEISHALQKMNGVDEKALLDCYYDLFTAIVKCAVDDIIYSPIEATKQDINIAKLFIKDTVAEDITLHRAYIRRMREI